MIPVGEDGRVVLQPFGLPIRFDWSKVRRLFCCTLTTTSGWQGTVVVSEGKEKEGKGRGES